MATSTDLPVPLHYHLQSKEDLCRGAKTPGFFQQKLLLDPGSLLGFPNLPGPAGRGLCWWHSRLTRAANYLAIFRPDIPRKPTEEEVEEILEHLRLRDKVVEVPGMRNFREFSIEFPEQFASLLSFWSLKDAFSGKLSNAFIGKTKEEPQTLAWMMDELFRKVHDEGKIVFQTLQFAGLSAHAWLVVDMKKTDHGYELQVVDSYYSSIQRWTYYRGQPNFYYSFTEFLPLVGAFVPYTNLDWEEEETAILEVVHKYCREAP